jgi:hypothetical protein
MLNRRDPSFEPAARRDARLCARGGRTFERFEFLAETFPPTTPEPALRREGLAREGFR